MNEQDLPPPEPGSLMALPVLKPSDAITDFSQITPGDFYMTSDFDGFNEETRKLEAQLAIRDVEMIYEAHLTILEHTSGQPMHYRSLATQLATSRSTGARYWERRIVNAIMLKTSFEAVYEEMQAGTIAYWVGVVIPEEGLNISDETKFAQYINTGIEYAQDPSMTAAKLRPIMRELAQALSDQPIDAEEEDYWTYHTRGGVQIDELGGGLALLKVVLPAAEAYAVKKRLQGVAREKKQELSEERREFREREAARGNHIPFDELPKLPRISRLEHETAAEILAGTLPDGYQHIVGTVNVTIPAFSLLTGKARHTVEELQDLIGDLHALSGEATLEGYGPIPIGHATAIAGTAKEWLRMFIDPHSGHIITTDAYQAPKALKQLITYRDPTCRFMGCTRKAEGCDKDHTIPYRLLKETSPENLANLCRYHHLAKHHAGWHPEQVGNGVIKWTSASGKVYMSHPYVAPIQPPTPTPVIEEIPAPF